MTPPYEGCAEGDTEIFAKCSAFPKNISQKPKFNLSKSKK